MEYEYDTAISFLDSDLKLACDLRDLLSPHMEVFLYTDRQEDIACTDGTESLRSAFRDQARLLVVLYRDGWGETDWTRVEEHAIKDRFLKEGIEPLIFIKLTSNSTLPSWLPDSYIYFNLEKFSIEQAVGIIRHKMHEIGATIPKEAIADRARRVSENKQFNDETMRIWRSYDGIREVRKQMQVLSSELAQLAAEMNQAAPDLGLEVGIENARVVVRSAEISFVAELYIDSVNSLDDSCLYILLYRGKVLLPGERVRFRQEAKLLSEQEYVLARTKIHGWCWADEQDNYFTSSNFAEHLLRQLLELLESEE